MYSLKVRGTSMLVVLHLLMQLLIQQTRKLLCLRLVIEAKFNICIAGVSL